MDSGRAVRSHFSGLLAIATLIALSMLQTLDNLERDNDRQKRPKVAYALFPQVTVAETK